MRKFTLYDNSFFWRDGRYQNSMVAGRLPKYFEFTKEKTGVNFYSYTHAGQVTEGEKNYLVLLESRGIVPDYFAWAEQNWMMYDAIFTHSSSVLEKCPNAKWIPGGGLWIGGEFGGCDLGIYEKTKIVSMVSSDKVMCQLHADRLSLAIYLDSKIDVYGTFKNPNAFVAPSEYLRDYMFCIQIENFVDELYFTEKLLNCFATGTVPVYVGASNIGKYFDNNGVINVKYIHDIPNIIKALSKENYESRSGAIENNFKICQLFKCPEDFIWENYLREEYE